MVKGSLYRRCSFEMTFPLGDGQERGISKSLKLGDILSSSSRPHNMLVHLNRRHPGKTGDRQAQLEI